MGTSPLAHALRGAVAGFVATVPMTVAMLAVQRLLPKQEQTRLEPRRISDKLLRRAGVLKRVEQEQRPEVALASHFGYGTSVGMMYPLVEPIIPAPRALRGPLFGLGVWAASYAGWLPAADILPPPEKRPAGRNALLIFAHLVWGAALQRAASTMSAIDTSEPEAVQTSADRDNERGSF